MHALDLTLGAAAGLPSDVAMMPAVQELADSFRDEAKTDMAKLAKQYPKTRQVILEGLPRQVLLEAARRKAPA